MQEKLENIHFLTKENIIYWFTGFYSLFPKLSIGQIKITKLNIIVRSIIDWIFAKYISRFFLDFGFKKTLDSCYDSPTIARALIQNCFYWILTRGIN